MYADSDIANALMALPGHKFAWHGTITAKRADDAPGGESAVYRFGPENIVQGTGKITRQCSGDNVLELGSVYAAELSISLRTNISRYVLYDGVIDLYCTLEGGSAAIWSDYADDRWDELAGKIWFDMRDTYDYAMGKFVISEINRRANHVLEISAYDYMAIKVDANLGRIPAGTRTPFYWLKYIAEQTGVDLGVTQAEIAELPNGNRLTGYGGDDATDCSTYRDLLGFVASMVCGVAFIDRFGQLVVKPYPTVSIKTIPPSGRYSSEMSDFIAYYSGMYMTYKAGGQSEYYSNTQQTGKDDGLVYNLGVHPFLQFTVGANRKAAVQAIMDRLSGVRYAPFKAEIPMDPNLDLLDMVTLTGNQAGAYDTAAITKLELAIGGTMSISCGAGNPRLEVAKNRSTHNIEGLLSEPGSVGGDFGSVFIGIAHNDEEIVLTATPQLVMQTPVAVTGGFLRTGITVSVRTYLRYYYELVITEIRVDGKAVYSGRFYDSAAGLHQINTACGVDITGAGTHIVSAYMWINNDYNGDDDSGDGGNGDGDGGNGGGDGNGGNGNGGNGGGDGNNPYGGYGVY